MTDVLYAAKGSSATTSDLYTVNPATATPSSVGPIGFALTGLAMDPTDSALYGATSNNSAAHPKSLISVDPVTGAGTLIGAFSPAVTITDITFDSTGQLYGWDHTHNVLTAIDKATGAQVSPGGGGVGTIGEALDFNASDDLYALLHQSGGHLYTIDPSSGVAAEGALLDVDALVPSGSDVQCPAASFGQDGLLWAIYGSGFADQRIGTVDTSTATWADVGSLGPTGGSWDALAWTRSVTPPPPAPSRRFFAGYPWRFIVTDLDTKTITFLDRLATGRTVTVARNQPRDASGTVPSDNPEINILHTDGDPFLAEGNRLVYGFRREGWDGLVGPWVCRFAGLLDHIEDTAGTDAPATHWAARDPWQKLYKVPLRLAGGGLPGTAGRVFAAGQSYQTIAKRILTDSILYDGTCFIDPDGGTVSHGAATAADITFQQGLSVGAAWDQLCATGNIDILLDPVYDPVGSPGICCTFNAKPVIGEVQNAAIFAWDLPSRSLASVSRVIDGTGRENTIQYYFGQGGPPVSQQIDAASVAKYGEYWAQQFWPGFREAGPVAAMAARRLALVKDGLKTFTFAPAPERSPIPFDDYMPGDWAPFFASKKLRAPLQPTLASGQWTNIPRIEAFTVQIADNQTETVSELLTAMDVQP